MARAPVPTASASASASGAVSAPYDPGQTLRRWWLAEGYGPGNRRWVSLCHETGKAWLEARLYGPPSVAQQVIRITANTVPVVSPTYPGLEELKARAALLLPLAWNWIETGDERALERLRKEWEDD